MRKRPPWDLTGHCLRCYMRAELCVCPIIPRIATRTQYLILRHRLEGTRTSNTGRLAHLALPNSQLIDYGGGEPFDGEQLAESGTWLLYMDGSPAPQSDPPKRLVILDGTWRQARRMFTRIPQLWRMPRLTLPAPVSPVARLRQPTHAEGMSTLEAIAGAVGMLEGAENGQKLLALHAEAVRRGLSLRFGPGAVAGLEG